MNWQRLDRTGAYVYALHAANSFIRKSFTNVLTMGLTNGLEGGAHEPQFDHLLFWLNSKGKGKGKGKVVP
jgi:hypothetical protein